MDQTQHVPGQVVLAAGRPPRCRSPGLPPSTARCPPPPPTRTVTGVAGGAVLAGVLQYVVEQLPQQRAAGSDPERLSREPSTPRSGARGMDQPSRWAGPRTRRVCSPGGTRRLAVAAAESRRSGRRAGGGLERAGDDKPPVEELLLAWAYLDTKQADKAKERGRRRRRGWTASKKRCVRRTSSGRYPAACLPGVATLFAAPADPRYNAFDWETWHELAGTCQPRNGHGDGKKTAEHRTNK